MMKCLAKQIPTENQRCTKNGPHRNGKLTRSKSSNSRSKTWLKSIFGSESSHSLNLDKRRSRPDLSVDEKTVSTELKQKRKRNSSVICGSAAFVWLLCFRVDGRCVETSVEVPLRGSGSAAWHLQKYLPL